MFVFQIRCSRNSNQTVSVSSNVCVKRCTQLVVEIMDKLKTLLSLYESHANK